MMFHSFHSQVERKKFGGSAFVEMQFCKMKPETDIKTLVSADSIWQNDSLYIYLDDIDNFYDEYCNVFNCGIYNNLKSGVVDLYGINYYKPDLVESIIARVLERRTTEYEILVEWLNKAKNYNGFYILGI